MITEDYCSFELSKLLKEKGFNEDCKAYYEDGKFCWVWNDGCSRNTDNPKYVCCPSQALAMKWLREVYKISIEIYCIPSYTKGLVVWRYMIRNCETCDEVDYPNGYPAQEYLIFEEAVEAALKYSLENLI